MKPKSTQFVSDLEGPLTLNDNAFEITAHFLPDGARFFKLISRYDDIVADVLKRENYNAGDTLKLILPFWLAVGLCDRDLKEYSRKSVKLVPGARQALQSIFSQMPTFIISTSYEPYVQAVCETLDFPFENAYCTKVSLDSYNLPERERRELQALCAQIGARSPLKLPKEAQTLDDFSAHDRETIAFLDDVFWHRLATMEAGRLLREIQPVGGPEKARALLDSVQRTGVPFSKVIYIGDSITDTEALQLVRHAGGLAVAFNGNNYALRAAELGCISPDASILAHIAGAFAHHGRDAVRTLNLKDAELTDKIDQAFIQRSEQMRRRLRGEQIGGLG
jgi:predicted HAD superfamily phosphohydrolase